ncbi:LVIVD repeat-containing protein [Mangrovivirga cuniculi]|uniref:LVIVD repeat-containing protein n=1 Tax=Mangrovivirga cuniculi TaxID=2715131 RepID=A0A4D7JP98_9BACT|nr:choice-of-anchor B family protein [Mangrovivirga cuniculi]QCK16593.1 hypothetical protein DCC35_18595 [Mangrovivirga cuniculi]
MLKSTKIILAISIILITLSCGKNPEPILEDEKADIGKYPANQLISSLDLDVLKIYDLWGYIDPATNNKYILAGYIDITTGGIVIIDVTDPYNPTKKAFSTGSQVLDIKTYDHYAYITTGNNFTPSYIIDLKDINNPQIVNEIPESHNIFIVDDLLMLTDSGTRIYDISSDPANPIPIWGDSLYSGHDLMATDQYLYDFHTSKTIIYSRISDSEYKLLSEIKGASVMNFHHSGWVTDDENFLFICDEFAGREGNEKQDITIWDISDKTSPEYITSINDNTSTVHNIQIQGEYAYVSYYTAGYKVFNISNPASPKLIYEYDTNPEAQDNMLFDGAFGVYTLFNDGKVYVSDMQNGLFIFGNRFQTKPE